MTAIENKNIKIGLTALAIIILFIISTVITITAWKNSIDKDISDIQIGQRHLVNSYNIQQEKINKLDSENIELKIKLATIETKLTNIEILLVEIKQQINK